MLNVLVFLSEQILVSPHHRVLFCCWSRVSNFGFNLEHDNVSNNINRLEIFATTDKTRY